ncbi:MAG: long-chain-fatty-acid--CoA ligase [Deltaproteobacteria bacterium]|nr:long-chain-fatty-acid--CoA ligase [Deltaproteobacteria bacterium]
MTIAILTTGDLVNSNAERYSDTPFLNFYDEIVTYKDLDDRTDGFANYLLEKGVKKGDVVSFMMGNSPYFFYTLLGAHKIGAIGGPISCWWQAEEVEFLVNDSRPKVLMMDPEYTPIVSEIKGRIPSVKQIIINSTTPMGLDFPHEYLPKIIDAHSGELDNSEPPAGDDPASVMYTSGTTGKPKGVLLTHRGIVFGAQLKTEHVPVHAGEGILCVLPLFHSGGLNDLAFPTMYRGATIVLRRNFSASEFWECVERYKVNGFYIVPTMWNILLKVPEADNVDTSSLRLGLSGAAPIPPEQLEECERRFHIPILEAYGSTENSGGITANMSDKKKYGSVGTAFSGIEVKIFSKSQEPLPAGEIGEIVVKGDTVMKGYFNNPEATAETIRDGWLYTGDLGYLDEEGFLFIVDRMKDMIIRGGVNVYPKEIENIIATHPAVDAVAVIPEPHEKYGQVAKACIVLKRGQDCSEEEIHKFCREKMADYKVPEHIIFREGLPTNAVGKVIKKELIRHLEEEKSDKGVSVAYFFHGMQERFIPEKAEGADATVSYNITGKGGGKWTVAIKDGKMTLTEGLIESPRVYLVARSSDYHDIVTGKLDGITAVMTGKLKIDGDMNFMKGFGEMFEPLRTGGAVKKTL